MNFVAEKIPESTKTQALSPLQSPTQDASAPRSQVRVSDDDDEPGIEAPPTDEVRDALTDVRAFVEELHGMLSDPDSFHRPERIARAFSDYGQAMFRAGEALDWIDDDFDCVPRKKTVRQ